PDDGAILAGLRFKALGIPQGARIQKAQIEFVSAETYEADENVAELIAYGALLEDRTDLSAEEIADLSEESFRNNKFLSQNFPGPAEVEAEKATQGVNWRFDEQLAEKQTFKTPDLKSIIQQLVNQQKWQSDSNAILLFKPAATNEGGRRFYSYDSFNPPILTVYWTPADGKVSLLAEPIDDRTYSNQRIEYKNRNGDLKSSTETIFLGDNWDDNTAGLRFFPVGIPSNAEIKEAKIIFTHQSDSDKVEAANEEPLELNIYGEKNSSEPFNRDIGFSSRIPTEHAESWSHTETPQAGASFSSPDLSEIVKEIIAQPGWQAGEGMAFFFEEQSGNNGYRRIVGADDIVNTDKTNLEAREVEIVPDETTLARLEITYSAGEAGEETAENDTQLIGLRFENIDIPTYAKVKAASIEFTSAQANTEPATLIIQGEKLSTSADPASAAEFAEEEANISQRERTDAQVTWDVDPWYGGNLKYTSPDLTAVVQEIVNHSGWCGGRDAMAFIISGEGEAPLRIAQSYDGDPRNAPVLTVEFDSQEQDISGDACVQQNFSGRISSENNDAEEIVGGSEDSLVYLKTPTLELGTHQDKNLVGLRFTDVPVGSQAKIEKAELIFTSVKNDSNKTMRPADLTISGEKSLNAAAFSDSDGDLSQRAKTQNVSWVINEEWENGKLYQSVDISPVVQEIIQQSGWEAYSSMAFFITGTGLRKAISFRSDPSEAPVLRIQVQGYLGEDGQGSFMTVRRRLKRITKNMEIPGGGWTPIVDGLYEAALYYRGQRVDYGKTRHDQSIYLVSHPGTYDGGVLDRPEACSIVKPYAEECAAEKITGAPDYISPITTPCQTNHIVFLTDGDATTISAADKVRNLVGKMDCYSEYEDPDEDSDEMVAVTKEQSCGLDLAEFLNTTDNNTEVAEPQNIQVHAIGFQLGKGWKRLRVEKTDENGNVIYEIDSGTGNHLRDKNGDKIPVMVPAGWIEDEKETEDNERAVKFLKTLAKKGGGNFYAADSAE
ncbi:MAG: hypothetical protein SVR94_12150, partial [Pseudomonadota bacterium]|nr:hypothetical protein [Pseudomonadota bacterium]